MNILRKVLVLFAFQVMVNYYLSKVHHGRRMGIVRRLTSSFSFRPSWTKQG